MNREYAKLGALLHLQAENTVSTLDFELKAYIEAAKELLKKAIKNHDKNGLTDAEIEKLVENISKEDFENKSPYDLAREFVENRNRTQTQEQKKETFDEKITRLMKEGLSLGKIKEAHPELDVLVPKEFEAEALGRNTNVAEEMKEEQIKSKHASFEV
ncbi:TPA: hypothetical protein ACK3JH_000193 [Mannheimia haemolytica]